MNGKIPKENSLWRYKHGSINIYEVERCDRHSVFYHIKDLESVVFKKDLCVFLALLTEIDGPD